MRMSSVADQRAGPTSGPGCGGWPDGGGVAVRLAGLRAGYADLPATRLPWLGLAKGCLGRNGRLPMSWVPGLEFGVNQVGYLPDRPMQATLISPAEVPVPFVVRDSVGAS